MAWDGSPAIDLGLLARNVVQDPAVSPMRMRRANSLTGRSNVQRFSALFILAALIASPATAFAADPLPASGAAKLAAYVVCRSLAIVDMGPVGSNSSAECTGIVKTRSGSKLLDNLAIRCLEEAQGPARGLRLHRHVHPDGRRRRQALHDLRRPGGRRHCVARRHGQVQGHSRQGDLDCADAPGNNAKPFCVHPELRRELDDKEK